MMSIETLRYLNNKAAARAKAEGKRPAICDQGYREDLQRFADEPGNDRPPRFFRVIPNMGIRKNWQKVRGIYNGYRLTGEEAFIDKTGTGADYDPAMTWKQFARWLLSRPEGRAYGIVDNGPMQMTIAEWEVRA